jgi:hypothetical protein
MNKNLNLAIFISGTITIVSTVLLYRESLWGILIWPGVVFTLGVGLVNLHGDGTHAEPRLFIWSAIFSFVG